MSKKNYPKVNSKVLSDLDLFEQSGAYEMQQEIAKEQAVGKVIFIMDGVKGNFKWEDPDLKDKVVFKPIDSNAYDAAEGSERVTFNPNSHFNHRPDFREYPSDLIMAIGMAQQAGKHALGIDPAVPDIEPPKIFSTELIEEMVRFYDGPILKQKQRCYIGIDNGVSGSIGIIREDGSYAFHKTPTRSELNYTKAKAMITRIIPIELTKLLKEAGPGSMVMIERPMVNPTRFKATMSALRSFEATITILETLGLSYEYIDSKEWQKPVLPKGISGDDLKPASLDVGNRLYPDAKGVKHPDRDGILIAHYCKSKHR